jgi:transcriptional regulator with XRE-family HTH domain
MEPSTEPAAAIGKSAQDGQEVSLGRRIREKRQARGVSLTRLSRLAEISVGMLSQIENGVSSPSLRSLRRISEALDVPLGRLFDDSMLSVDDDGVVVRKAARPRLDVRPGSLRKEILSPPGAKDLEMILVVIEPDGGSGEDPYSHQGEEVGLVLRGSLELWVGERRYALEAGDSFQFRSTIPHRFSNPSDERAEVLWIVSPPFYARGV